MGLFNNFKLGRDNLPLLTIRPTVTFENTEWAFQFDDDEPRVFATQTDEPNLTITLNNTNNASIEFTNNNRRFKIFARERQQ